MPLPREDWQEDSLDPGPQDLSPGSDPRTTHIVMIEEPASMQVTYARSDSPRPSTVEGTLKLGQSHQVGHSNNVKTPIDINLDAATLASTSGEDHNFPSQSSRLIPEYVNLCISGLWKSIRIQGKYKNRDSITKGFGLIVLFTYVAISVTKSFLPNTLNFGSKIIHLE